MLKPFLKLFLLEKVAGEINLKVLNGSKNPCQRYHVYLNSLLNYMDKQNSSGETNSEGKVKLKGTFFENEVFSLDIYNEKGVLVKEVKDLCLGKKNKLTHTIDIKTYSD